jgi:methyltransferase (TIGR00027 family)
VVPPRSPSRTAILTAVGRGLHREGPGPHVFRDDLARDLAGEEGEALIEQLRAELSEPLLLGFTRWVSARARFTEDMVERAIAAGVRQYVILGAGLDSFAYRRHDLVARLRVFEVDHPASQSWKRRRLAELHVDAPRALVFVPVDFEQETLADALERAGFDGTQPALFSWIGVTMYLGLDAIERTLRTIASYGAATQVVLTYNVPASARVGLERDVGTAMAKIVTGLGEPFVTTFEPPAAESLLRRTGFRDIAMFSPSDAVEVYFDGRSDINVGAPQRLLTATVS